MGRLKVATPAVEMLLKPAVLPAIGANEAGFAKTSCFPWIAPPRRVPGADAAGTGVVTSYFVVFVVVEPPQPAIEAIHTKEKSTATDFRIVFSRLHCRTLSPRQYTGNYVCCHVSFPPGKTPMHGYWLSSTFFLRRALGAGLGFSSGASGGGETAAVVFFGAARRRGFGAAGASSATTWT